MRHLDGQFLADLTRGDEGRCGGIGQADRGPEHGEHRVALELVDQPVVLLDGRHHHGEELVQDVHHIGGRPGGGQGGGADDVDEQHSDSLFAAAEFGVLRQGGLGDLLADVATEQVAQAFAFAEPGDHRVEARLQVAEFGAVEDHHPYVVVSAANPAHPLPDGTDGRDDAVHAQEVQNRPGEQCGGAQDRDGDEDVDLGGVVAEQPEDDHEHHPDDGDA